MVEKAEKRYGKKIWLIQDCCHAFGADWKGKMIGTSGDVAIYALNISKIITSIFGGMLTFQDQKLANKIRDWRDTHFKSGSWLKSIKRRLYLLAIYFAFNEKVYSFTLWLQHNTSILNKLTKAYHLDNKIHFPPDYLDKMLNVEAAVGLKQLKKYPKIIQFPKKRQNFIIVTKKEGWFYHQLRGATYSHYTVRVPNRNEVIFHYKRMELMV